MYKGIKCIVILLALTGCSIENSPKGSNSDVGVHEQETAETIVASAEVLATNLNIPWTITKQDETFYISQREGSIIEFNRESGSVKVQQLIKKVSVQNRY